VLEYAASISVYPAMKTQSTVTWGNWSVSVTTGSRSDGAVLSVVRHYDPSTARGRAMGVNRYKMAYGELNGVRFATSEEAWAAALARGYIQTYRRVRKAAQS
jgi:hypothetical protein